MRDTRFANRLKSIRKSCGLTQLAVATAVKIDRSTYTYYETAKSYPDVEMLQKLARVFSVSMNTLLGLEEPAKAVADDALSLSSLSQEEQQLVLRYRLMSEEEKEQLQQQLTKTNETNV